jgi:hypothetical protein
MDAALIAAGSLALLGAAIHGGAGEVLVVRKLSPDALPPSPFGGPRMTKAMIHVTWHMTTSAFVVVGVALLLAGSVLEGEAARGVAVMAAAACAGFWALAVGLGFAYMRAPRHLLRHPAPALLTAVAALAWWGALSTG